MTRPTRSKTALCIRIVVVGLGAAMFFEQAGGPSLLQLDGFDTRHDMVATDWVRLIAPALFLFALWAASDVFARMKLGEAFGPAMVRGLRQIGGGLMFGAFAAILVQPSLVFLVGNGFQEMRGAKFDLSIANLTLGLVGIVLILLAREGEKLRSNLDEFV